MTASEAWLKKMNEGGKGYATALEKANASGADKLKAGVEGGGDAAAAKIAAAGQVMAAKFEGTGRNIYDLWNNWGDSFIDGFGTSIGKLLVQFQQAQTRLLREQAELLKQQARNMELQNKYLERGKPLPGSGGGSSGGEDKTTTGGGSVGDSWLFKPKNNKKSTDTDTSSEGYASKEEAIRDVTDNRPLTIINRMEPSSILGAISSRAGGNTILNSIAADPDKFRKALGIGG